MISLGRRALLALALCGSAALGSAASAQTADELVAKHLEARGGAAALAAIKSIQFDGKLLFPGDFELTYKEVRARGANGPELRFDAALQGLTLVQAYDGKIGWRINPFQGRRDAERMSDDEARSLADQASLDGPLLSAKADGSKVEYLGREEFDGTSAYKLKVTQKDGDEFVYLLEPETMLAIKMVETRRVRGALTVSTTEMGDYEKVAGVYFPMSLELWQGDASNQRQRLIIDKATANPDVSPALFAQPGDAPAATTPKVK